MNKTKKIILTPFLFIIFTFIFTILDVGLIINQFDQIIQPVFFSASLIICLLYSSNRKYILIVSIILLFLMILIYLLNMIVLSNWVGSLGLGILFITFTTYIPQLIKVGYIEKL